MSESTQEAFEERFAALRIPEEYVGYDFKTCLTAIDNIGPYFKEDVIAAIYHSRGHLGEMAYLLNRNRARVRDYVFANRDVKEVFDNIRETSVDYIERSHMTAALMGDAQAERFTLTTLGKGRGYTTRVEATGEDGGAIRFQEVVRKIVDPVVPPSDEDSAADEGTD